MKLSQVSCISIVGAALAAAACSASGPNAVGSSDDLVMNPTGNENESHLTLQLPTDACLPGANCAKVLGRAPSIFVDGDGVSLGASTRVKPGAHTIAVNGVSTQVTTTGGQSLTVILPIAARKCTNAALPNVPTTDFGGSVTVASAACPTSASGSATGVPNTGNQGGGTAYYDANCTNTWTSYSPGSAPNCSNAQTTYSNAQFSYRFNGGGGCTSAGVGYAGCVAAANALSASAGWTPGVAPLTDAYQAYPPGTLTASVNGTSQTLTLKAGDESEFDLNLPPIGTVPATFGTNISFADARTNPNATGASITSNCGGDRNYSLPGLATTTLALNAFVKSQCTYTLNVGGRTQALSQTVTNNITLHRLDVNDVTVTREDGTTYTVKGSYSLNYGGVQVAGPFTTGTGIDVLPGTYQFSLSYTSFDGPQTQTQTLTF
jgi:hypothetical protein